MLVVDDDTDDRALMAIAFQSAGITTPVKEATDGQAAVDYLSGAGEFADRRANPMPSLVLLDLKMPRKTGFEVLEWRRADSVASGVPIVVLSASNAPSDVERAYRLGANGYFLKPTTLAELTKLCGVLKNYWLELAELPF